MKIVEIKELALPEVKVIRHARFPDERGYFTESYQQSLFEGDSQLQGIFTNRGIAQINESYSKPNTIRGLHMQWAPPQGKLVRTLTGHMVDIVVDIRTQSPHFGKGIMYDMPADPSQPFGELIWVPFGFAHGNYYPQESRIEYMVTAEWSGPGGEGGISPFSDDIDWSLCDQSLYQTFKSIETNNPLVTQKDRDGFTIEAWSKTQQSTLFTYDPNKG